MIGMWLCTLLMFSCPPEFSTAVKAAWIFVMYSFVNAIFATFLNASNTVYMVRAFNKEEHYVAINSYGSIISMIFAIIINVTFPVAMASLATSAAGWRTLIAIYAIPLALLGILRFFTIKEKYNVNTQSGLEEKIHLKDVAMVLKKNPYIYIVALMTLTMNFVTNMGVGQYYYEHIVHNIGLMGLMAITQIILLPVMFVFPAIIRKLSVAKLITIGILVSSVGYLVNFIAYTNVPLLIVGGLLTGIGGTPISMLTILLIVDCAEFNEWTGLPRLEGTLSSVNGFAQKVGSAAGVWVLGLLLTASGYDTVTEMAVIPDSAALMIRLLFSLIPMVLFLIVAVVLRFYKLDNLMPQIKADKAAKEERKTSH